MVSRTGRNKKGFEKILRANVVSRIGINKKLVREDILQ